MRWWDLACRYAARRGSAPRHGPLAKLGQPCLCCLHRAIDDRDGVLRAAVTPGQLDRRAPCPVHGGRLCLGITRASTAAPPQSLMKWYIRYESLPRCSSRYISVPGAPENKRPKDRRTVGTWRPTRSRYRGELLSIPRRTSVLISRFEAIRIGMPASAASQASYSRNPRKSV